MVDSDFEREAREMTDVRMGGEPTDAEYEEATVSFQDDFRIRDLAKLLAEIRVAKELLTDVQYAIANLNGVEIPYDRSRPLSRCYNANAMFLADMSAPPSVEQATAPEAGAR